MTGILAPPKHEQVEIEVNGSTYILRDMTDREISDWTRQRRETDAAMVRYREKYGSDEAILQAIKNGEHA